MDSKRILIAEDDNGINGMLSVALAKEGYATTSAFSGTEALSYLKNQEFSLVILDLMLPGIPGEEVLRRARTFTDIPVIVLSAKDALDSKVDLLTLGANDYMTKPFELQELLVRVMVQLRNGKNNRGKSQLLDFEELCLDMDRKEFLVCGQLVSLTAREMKIMELLMQCPGKVFSKNELYEYAWEDYYMGEDKTINVHISNIRKKIKKYSNKDYIETVWGQGFKL